MGCLRLLLFPLPLLLLAAACSDHAAVLAAEEFTYNGFSGANLTLDGMSAVAPNGLLALSNGTSQMAGHAFHPTPVRLRDVPGGAARSFSASFVFAIVSNFTVLSDNGMAFVVAPSTRLSTFNAGQYLGVLNVSDNGNDGNRVLFVELDTMLNPEFQDMNSNHVGVNVNSMRSLLNHSAGYYDDATGAFSNLSLISRQPMQVWVDYDGPTTRLQVTMAPMAVPKPKKPLISAPVNLSAVGTDTDAYVGFSAATGVIFTRHYVLGWSFSMDSAAAPALDTSKLPTLPRFGPKPRSKLLDILLPIGTAAFVLALLIGVFLFVRRRIRYAEKVVIHRDIKASNVLLDADMGGRLGDFGLARLYDHGVDPQTTHVVGTMGYLAPELVRTGKATPVTDVFAFGVFVLEVTCGRRPLGRVDDEQSNVLLDWVQEHERKGAALDTVDPRLCGKYDADEARMVIRLGLACAHPVPGARPGMRQVAQYLEGDAPMPEVAPTCVSYTTLALMQNDVGFDSFAMSFPSTVSSSVSPVSGAFSSAVSGLSGGRIALVTGGNKGIGLETCRQLASKGLRVVLTARNEARGLEAVEAIRRTSGGAEVLFHQLDVTDPSSAARLADFVRDQFGRLDILINNAGISGVDRDSVLVAKIKDKVEGMDVNQRVEWMRENSKETYEEAKQCMRTNYYGAKIVTEALLPLLQLSSSGRIVNVSSGFGLLRNFNSEELRKEFDDVDNLTEKRLEELLDLYLEDFKANLVEAHGWPTGGSSAYKVAKAALNAYTRILAKKYPTLHINCLTPGYVKTDMSMHMGVLTLEEGARNPVKVALLPDDGPTGAYFDLNGEASFV
ncbi:hypothetical protein HU200_031504 [Digitaria exilis]|uniref:Protein kinase domain-containing protein n=1 Tax=Digitaria exilis TaxID=1010633 RepID=A0A835BPE4_9POAL|nr:hypothetical protein HU200_031504 [Digitaria exilis]